MTDVVNVYTWLTVKCTEGGGRQTDCYTAVDALVKATLLPADASR